MAATISATYVASLSVVETFSGGTPSNPDATFAGLDESGTLNAGSAVPATKHGGGELAMTAGAATIDLTALSGITVDEVVNGTGLKVQIAEFRNKSTNANDIVVTFGAANPYLLLGATWKITLKPGQYAGFILKDGAPDVAGGAKNIDVSGTGTQILEHRFVMG